MVSPDNSDKLDGILKAIKLANYRYTLDNRRGRMYIHVCPRCGKREMRRYVDTDTWEYIDDKVGRCNREIKCGYHYKPREFFQDNPWLKNNWQSDNYNRTSLKASPPTSPQLMNVTHECVSLQVANSRCQGNRWVNPFTRWLARLLTYKYGGEVLQEIIHKYRIGTIQGGDGVIFWQIDTENKVRTGKIMYYNEATGKRIKDGSKPKADWIHTRLERAGKLPAGYALEQCLFGAHLISVNPNAVIFVFESEKTALVAAACFPDCICLATGGLHGLNAEKCKILARRSVVFFADLDATDKWRVKVEEIARSVQFAAYEVSSLLEQESTAEEKAEGFDLCDYLVRELTS